MSAVNCSCCGTSAHKSLYWSVCDKPFKLECVGISSAEARQIHLKSGLTWSCKQCIQVGSDINNLRRVIVDMQNPFSLIRQLILRLLFWNLKK